MGDARIWVALGFGGVAILCLLAVRSSYSYYTFYTPHFIVRLPKAWRSRSAYVVAVLEACHAAGLSRFDLQVKIRSNVDIRPSWRPAFWFEPNSRRIVLCFMFGPSVDCWLFLTYFAIAHEYGHMISPAKSSVSSEAWANLFALFVLYYVFPQREWAQQKDRLLIRRDAAWEKITLRTWRILPGRRRLIAMNFWHLWQIAEFDSKAVVRSLQQDV